MPDQLQRGMTMAGRRVKCPHCGASLALPDEVRQCRVRCGHCRQVFWLPSNVPVPEDTILGWLRPSEEDAHPAERPGTLAPLEEELLGAGSDGWRKAQRRSAQGLRLGKLGRGGAVFEFPASLLRSVDFRCAMPRVCVHCLAHAHLSARLIVFVPQLPKGPSLEAQQMAGRLGVPQEQLGDLSGEELLARLPEVPGVPAPANLPMPYWVCSQCGSAEEVSAQIRVDPETQRGTCRLAIRNLQVASSFFAAAGGEGSTDYVQLLEFLKHLQQHPWDALPAVVRHRLEQWYRPGPEERFLAYVPDRDFGRSEMGMAGLAVSDCRLVYHRPPIRQEFPADGSVTMQTRVWRNRTTVTLLVPGGKPCPVRLDRKDMMVLRRVLSEVGFKAIWD